MGHYDSCREADEAVRHEEKGRKFRDIVQNRSDKELEDFLDNLSVLREMSKTALATAGQHEVTASARKSMDEFFKRRT